MKHLYALIFIVLNLSLSAQCEFTSTTDGNWQDASTWTLTVNPGGCPAFPNQSHNAVITNGDIVSLNDGTTREVLNLSILDGTLDYTASAAQNLIVKESLTASGSAGSRLIRGNPSLDHRLTIQSPPSINAVDGVISVSASSNLDLDGILLITEEELILNGALNILNAGNADYIMANIQINAGGTFNNNSPQSFEMGGNITNNSSNTFTGCDAANNACRYTYSDGATRSITGTGNTVIPRIVISNSSTVNHTGSNSTLTITNNILGGVIGPNEFNNQSGATLVLDDIGTLDVLGVDFDFSTNNIVRYEGGSTEFLLGVSETAYDQLEIAMDFTGAGVRVNGLDVTVNSIDIFTGTLSVITNNLLSVNQDINLGVGSRVIQVAGTIDVAGNFSLNGSGAIYLVDNAGSTLTVSGLTDINLGNFVSLEGIVTLNDVEIGGDPSGLGVMTKSGADNIAGQDQFFVNGDMNILASGRYIGVGDFSPNFFNVTVQTGGTWRIVGEMSPNFSGDLNIQSGTTFVSCPTSTGCEYSFTGSNAQINSARNISIPIVTINSGTFIELAGSYDLGISDRLNLTSGDLLLQNANLRIGSSASNINGGSISNYIIQSGLGRVIKEFPTTNFFGTFELPFGDATVYAPILMQLNTGTVVGASGEIQFEFVNANGHPNRDNDNTASGGDDDATGGTVATDYLNDYWTFTTTDITNINFSFLGDFTQGGFVGSTFNMNPTILRVGTPPGGSQTIDWHVVGANEAFGTGFVLPGTVAMLNVNNAGNQLNESNTWELYAMDNGLNGLGVERLPITLVSFDAEQAGNAVELNWVTADEENNEFFTVERSIDGEQFESIITVQGAGNSQVELSYQATDVAPVEGPNYYRLKQTDFNGEFEYSEIRRVDFRRVDAVIALKAYPNPTSVGGYLSISGLENIDIEQAVYKIISNSGHQMESGELRDIVDGKVRMTQRGMHFIQIIHPEGQEVLKILVH
jgi:hypothetical protein